MGCFVFSLTFRSFLYILDWVLYHIFVLQRFSLYFHSELSQNKGLYLSPTFFLSCIMLLVLQTKNSLPNTRLLRFSSVTFLSFTVLHFIFINDPFRIFVKDIRSVYRFFFFFCIWMSSCSGTICWKDYSFSIKLLLQFVKDQLTIFGRSTSELSILFHWRVYSFASICCLYYCSFEVW